MGAQQIQLGEPLPVREKKIVIANKPSLARIQSYSLRTSFFESSKKESGVGASLALCRAFARCDNKEESPPELRGAVLVVRNHFQEARLSWLLQVLLLTCPGCQSGQASLFVPDVDCQFACCRIFFVCTLFARECCTRMNDRSPSSGRVNDKDIVPPGTFGQYEKHISV